MSIEDKDWKYQIASSANKDGMFQTEFMDAIVSDIGYSENVIVLESPEVTSRIADHAAEVERLTAERDLLRAEADRLERDYNTASLSAERTAAERDAAVAAKERAVVALRFYADRKSYDGHYMMSPLVTQDQGKRARAALAAAPDHISQPGKKVEYAALAPEPWGGPEGEE